MCVRSRNIPVYDDDDTIYICGPVRFLAVAVKWVRGRLFEYISLALNFLPVPIYTLMWMDPKDDDVDNNRGFGTRQTHWLLDIY